ncbi:MAG TPA: hypothetical protein VJ742_13385 [Nitrososphaera sp.]|nr:hypothetical protein [Nitrososphaera sp.]
MSKSTFAEWHKNVYKYRYDGHIHVGILVGGIPTDPKVAEGWLKAKLVPANDEETITQKVAETMAERGITADEAVKEVAALKTLNGFKRDGSGLYIEGRQLKACIKEAANIRWPKARWGISAKGTKSFWAEHVFVAEDRLYLGVDEPTNVQQRFVSTWRGTGIQNEEYVENAEFDFTVLTDFDFSTVKADVSSDVFADLWVTAEQNGLGASRSQGYGKFSVISWGEAVNGG